MDRDQVEEQVRGVLVDALGLDEKKIDVPPDTSLKELGAESIDSLDILFRLERAMGRRFDGEDRYPIKLEMTITQVVDLCTKVMSAG